MQKNRILILFLLLFMFAGCEKYEKGQVTVKAPDNSKYNITDIELLDVEKFNNVLKSHEGKIVLVNFFGSWCPPCKAETPDFVAVYEKYKNENKFVIVGIAVDQNKADALKFVNDYNITYPVYQADSSLIAYFQINPIPASFVFNKDGSLLDSMVGYMSKNIVEQIAQYEGE